MEKNFFFYMMHANVQKHFEISTSCDFREFFFGLYLLLINNSIFVDILVDIYRLFIRMLTLLISYLFRYQYLREFIFSKFILQKNYLAAISIISFRHFFHVFNTSFDRSR